MAPSIPCGECCTNGLRYTSALEWIARGHEESEDDQRPDVREDPVERRVEVLLQVDGRQHVDHEVAREHGRRDHCGEPEDGVAPPPGPQPRERSVDSEED